jgi:hypothetical protein
MAGSRGEGKRLGMADAGIGYTCWPCRDEDGKEAVPATHRLLVREVGEIRGHEVWGCEVHISQLYLYLIELGKPLDVIVHNMATGACLVEAHLRQGG